MSSPHPTLSPLDTALIALEVVAQLNKTTLDTRAIIREQSLNDANISLAELNRVLKQQQFKAKIKAFNIQKPTHKRYPLPIIFSTKSGFYSVLLQLNTGKEESLIFDCQTKQSNTLPFKELASLSNEQCIVLSPALLSEQAKFVFNWFFQEIMKFKSVIAEVMLGSFLVQLFGLVTPLFIQVILDKVIVHRSLTTLDVLGIAFIGVIVFEFLLNIGRHYIFIHTANKIDAKLGAKLFKHLFGLPFVYFEKRKGIAKYIRYNNL